MGRNNDRYHTIFLDVGGTLLRANPSIGAIYSEVAAKHGIEVEAKVIEHNMRSEYFSRKGKERDKKGDDNHTLSAEKAKEFWHRLVRIGLGEAADTPNFDTFFEDVFEEFASAKRYRYFSEVEEALSGLEKAGHRIGIISNWDTRLRRVLNEMDQAKRFETIIISGEVGAEKPDPAIYDKAREMAGATNGERLLQVGDSRRDDYDGAIAAGFEARLLNRMAGDTLLTVLEDLFE